MSEQLDCKECGKPLWLDGIFDEYKLCHECYEKVMTNEQESEAQVYCGDCLVELSSCAHASEYKREKAGK